MSEKSETACGRPLLVTILAALFALIGVIAVVAGAVVLVFGAVEVVTSFDVEDADLSMVSTVGALFIIMGIVYLIIGCGLLKGWKIMWYLGILYTILIIICSAVSIAAGGYTMVVTLIIPAIILLYLFKPDVKQFFLKHE